MRRASILGTIMLATIGAWLAARIPLFGATEVKGPAFQATGAPDAEKLGWRLGTQAWTFNRVTFFEAVDKTAALGLKYIEAFPGQRVSKEINERFGPGMKPATARAVKDKLKAKGVKLVNFGVTGIPGSEAAARKFFQWAKGMGIETLVTESNPAFLDKLCGEFGINAAFHNHPRSWPPEKVLKACEGKSKRMGACADTGHWMRRNIKPLDGVRKLKGRIVSFHFKDLNRMGGHDVPWGTGAGDVKAVLAEVHRQGFQGVFSIEYEHTYSMADLDQCVKHFNRCAREIAAKAKK
jgi:sugar phosphate isomerase/epimerase